MDPELLALLAEFPTGLAVPAEPDPRTLKSANYVDLSKGYYPPTIKWALRVPTLKNGRWSPKGNNVWGDCTGAACGNVVKVQTWNNRNYYDPTDAEVLAHWARVANYNTSTEKPPGPGASSVDIFNDWRKNPYGGKHYLDSYMMVFATANEMIQRGLYRWGPLYFELNCPASMFAQVKPKNTPFSVVAGSPIVAAHAMIITGADKDGLGVQTWGYPKRMTWDFFWANQTGIYALFTKDWRVLGAEVGEEFDQDGFDRDLARATAA